MVISQPPGIIILLSCFTNAASIALSRFQRHLMFYTCNYNIRVTHRNGAIKQRFTRIRSTEGSSADCSLFILSLHALALHLAVKYYFKLLVWRFEHVGFTYIRSSYFLCVASRTALCYATNTIKWKNIPNIWHKSSTKYKEATFRLKR